MEDVEDLVWRFHNYANTISDVAYGFLKDSFSDYIKTIKKEGDRLRKVELDALNKDSGIQENEFQILGSRLDTWMQQLPLVSFNTSKYKARRH